MKEILLNDYFKVEPLKHDTFVVAEKQTYEEMGKIVATPEGKENYIGGVAFFDSYIAKKYPVIGGKPDEFQWFVPLSEIVKIEMGESSSGKASVSKTEDGGSIPSSPA